MCIRDRENVDEEEVEKLLQSHCEDLSNEDLQEIAKQTILEQAVDSDIK